MIAARHARGLVLLSFALALAACGGASAASRARAHTQEGFPSAAPVPGGPASGSLATSDATAPPPSTTTTPRGAMCVKGPPLTVHFYDAGQALSALITLPDGRRWLVDAGESATRSGCGPACATWHARVMEGLRQDLGTARLDVLWITHQHSDHLGGAPDILKTFGASLYVDNGLAGEAHAHPHSHGHAHDAPLVAHDTVVGVARRAASESGATLYVVDPDHAAPPLPSGANVASLGSVTLTPIVPLRWSSRCPSDPNACSIALRVDYCDSSILFTGDAPSDEEAALDTRGPVTLLQVGHQGSDTSTSGAFVTRIAPRYAVISSAKPDEGTNKGYCHPRAVTVRTLTAAMGGAGKKAVRAFDGKRCDAAHDGANGANEWSDVPASDRLWSTARDGDVVLRTRGDGVFERDATP
jgi:competence protein ComEC